MQSVGKVGPRLMLKRRAVLAVTASAHQPLSRGKGRAELPPAERYRALTSQAPPTRNIMTLCCLLRERVDSQRDLRSLQERVRSSVDQKKISKILIGK